MEDELKKQICDYFTGPELIDLLKVDVEDLVDLLWDDYIEENIEEIKEYMNYGS